MVWGAVVVLAQVMSASGCETPSSKLHETLGIVPRPDLQDGAFVLASDSGCSVTPIQEGEHIEKPFGRVLSGRPRGRVIVYVNGMAVTPEIQCESMREIQRATGATVIGIHNATDGAGRDLLEVMAQREMIMHRRSDGPLTMLGRSGNPAVATLRRLVVAAAVNDRTPPELWVHSQGGVIASLALYEAADVLKPLQKDIAAVKVVSFASAAPFWPSGPRYEHYVHGEDLVPRYTGLGGNGWFDDAKAGANAKVIRFGKGAPDLSHHDVLAIYLPRYVREHRP